ncbi:MAG: ABC transporter permease [Chloroflexota bacterium]|nr:ABC transporter permease [Chloroflexota bacterium]
MFKSKIWQIVKYEYTRHVFRRRFLFSLLSLPFAVIVMIGATLLIGRVSTNTTPVGYIDLSGALANPVEQAPSDDIFDPVIEFRPYQNRDQARADLESGAIQAYYVLPEDYPQDPNTELLYQEEPDSSMQYQFADFVRNTLLSSEDVDPQLVTRLTDGSLITIYSLDGSRQMRQDQWYQIFTPFIAGIMFIIVVMTSGGYLLQAVVEEKENRTMEIVITSVTPGQLMTGKIIGDIAVGLTQLIVWLIFGWIGLKVAGNFFPFLQSFSLPSGYIAGILLILLPAFVMIAALMAAIGSTMTEVREAQQISGLFSLPMTIPFYLTSSIMMNPNGPVAMFFSFFPLTSPITTLMRMSLTVVPTWQIALNIGILFVCAVFAIWFAGRAFRLGMLQYGKKLSLKDVLRKRAE